MKLREILVNKSRSEKLVDAVLAQISVRPIRHKGYIYCAICGEKQIDGKLIAHHKEKHNLGGE